MRQLFSGELRRVRVASFILALLLGLWGAFRIETFTDAPVLVKISEILFHTIQMATAQMPQDFGRGLADLPWQIHVARLLMPATFLWLTLSALVEEIRRPLRRAGVGLKRGHVILSGSGPLVRHLLTTQGSGAVLIAKSVTAEIAGIADRAGAVVVVGDPQKPASWQHAGIATARHAVLLAEDDADNVTMALALGGLTRHRAGMLTVLARVDDPDLRIVLEESLQGAEAPPQISLNLIGEAELTIRGLFRHHPVFQGTDLRGGERVRALVVGFGGVGEQVVLRLLKTGISGPGLMPEITVLDPVQDGSRFRQRHDAVPPLDAVRFVTADPRDEAVWRDSAALLEALTLVVLCQEEDSVNLTAALTLRRYYARACLPAPPLFLRQRRGDRLVAALRAAGPAGLDTSRIFVFGAETEEGDWLAALATSETMAETIHRTYLAEYGPTPGAPLRDSHDPWDRLKASFRTACLDQADHLPVKLAMLGLSAGKHPAELDPLAEVSTPALIETLTRCEHQRWSVSRFLAGWRPAAKRDDARRLHTDLVPFEALTDHDRAKDESVIRAIPKLYAALPPKDRRWLRRDVPIALPDDPAALAGFEAGFDALLAQFADRHPVLVLTLPNAAGARLVRRLRAHHRAPSLVVLLASPVDRILSDMPEAEARRDLVRLLDNAERVLPLRPAAELV